MRLLWVLCGLWLLALPVCAKMTLVRDGQPAATIVVSTTPNRSAWFAAGELQAHVRKITGATLPIATDDQEVAGPVILVGASTRTDALGLAKPSDLQPQEYLLRFLPNTVVLMGKDAANDPFPLITWGRLARAPGKFGQAISFDGTADALAALSHGFSDAAGTMEAWVHIPADAKGGGQIFRLDGKPWSYHILGRDGNVITYTTYDGKVGNGLRSRPLAAGWHHVMATWDAAAAQEELFIDGVSHGTKAYSATFCGHSLRFGIGAMTEMSAQPQGFYTGLLDEIRLSSVVRSPKDIALDQPLAADASTLLLLHCDEAEGAPRDASGRVLTASVPALTGDVGTCYAVYDFLEQCCGVRWYAPTELGMVYPKMTTLTVRGKNVRRTPAIATRANTGMPGGYARVLLHNPTNEEWTRWMLRLKAGGRPFTGNHGLYGYYDRFWAQNPKNPAVFEGKRPEFFAKGYDGVPPQLCFSSPELVAQVVQDIRDYFDGKGAKVGMNTGPDYVCIEPMDNTSYCKCPACTAAYNKAHAENTDFSNGQWSNLIFDFTNKVAREVRQTHPDKYVMVLAYHSHSYLPDFAVEPNVATGSCLGTRQWLSPQDAAGYAKWIAREVKKPFSEPKAYKEWVAEAKKSRRPLSLWLYHCFPQETGDVMGFHVFPGFHAHRLARHIKMFADDGIMGVFTCGVGEQLDLYLTQKLLDDPYQHIDATLHEFFTRYYGKAGAPLEKMYRLIEKTYGDINNYPGKKYACDEKVCWGSLGTAARMARMGRWMDEAKALAVTDEEKQRVAAVENGLWTYMAEGRAAWAKKEPFIAEVERLKQQPPPSITAPRVAEIGGDPAKADWTRGITVRIARTHEGYPADRQLEATLLHDGTCLYIRLVDHMKAADLVGGAGIFWDDRWEVFAAGQRAKPYRQLGIKHDGRTEGYTYGEEGGGLWQSGITLRSMPEADAWTTLIALPLAQLTLHGVQPGQSVFMNFYRPSASGRATLAWSPNFEGGYHNQARLAEVRLAQ